MSVLNKNFDVDIKKLGHYYEVQITLFDAFYEVSAEHVKIGTLRATEQAIKNFIENSALLAEDDWEEIVNNHINMWLENGRMIYLWEVPFTQMSGADTRRFSIMVQPEGIKIGELGLYRK